ncbi:glycosyltransferase family 61 protein [Palleronia sp. LCG004]|uniref:glycosyltransferase family 61 protein n=1 Tax=Palleronia sp. LCG004 TaxID=3079304 RepID=UPI002943A798|nr:glycosyltransferase family 61 protein [Palleronia sp. LCG004]WOI55685.1 glycosyltransferase family 61 protein [Palleronia sp. LCG004]
MDLSKAHNKGAMPGSAGSIAVSIRLLRDQARRRLLRRKIFTRLPAGEPQGPSDVVECLPAKYEPAQIDRVVACGFSSTISQEIEKLEATNYREVPLAACRLGRSMIVGGQILTDESRYYLGPQSPLEAMREAPKSYDRACVYNSALGLRYFGHWLHDDCSVREAVAGREPCISLRRPKWPDADVYETAFGHVQDQPEHAVVESLTVYADRAFSRAKAENVRALRRKLRERIAPRKKGQIVFLRRGPSAVARHIVEEEQLIKHLDRAGIRIVDPERGTTETIEELLDAALVISVEGSQAAHAVYCAADRGSMLILQPPDRFYNPGVEWCRMAGLSYGTVIGEAAEGGFRIHSDEVLSMVGRLTQGRAAPVHS